MRDGLFYRWLSLPAGIRLIFIAFLAIIPVALVWRFTHRPELVATRLALDEGQESQEGKGSPEERPAGESVSKSSQGHRLLMDDDEPPLGQPAATNTITQPERKKLDESGAAVRGAGTADSSPSSAESPSLIAMNGGAPSPPLGAAAPLSSPNPDLTGAKGPSVLEEVPQGTLNSPVKLSHYRFLLASTTYESSPTKQNHLERIAALERLTQVACMRKMLTTLSYREPPQELLCLAAIDKLLVLNPGSTSAICARDGIDSPSCLSADADTTTRVDSSKGAKSGEANASSEKFRSLKDQLSGNLNLLRSGSRGVSEEQRVTARSEATELASQLLGIACAGAKVFVRERPVVKVRDFSNSHKDPYGLSELLETQERLRGAEPQSVNGRTNPAVSEDEGLGQPRAPAPFVGLRSAKPTPKMTTAPLGLVYLVSSDCASTISTARSLDPALPALVCAERGRYSPRCVQAIRASQVAAKGGKGSADDFRVGEEEGFSRF